RSSSCRWSINVSRFVKPELNYHPTRRMDVALGNTQSFRLLNSSLRAANEELLLALDPKMGRIVREIGENRDERNRLAHPPQAFEKSTVEMRNQRDYKVRRIAAPILLDEVDLEVVIGANHGMQYDQQLARLESPVLPEHQVVGILAADAGYFAPHIDWIQHFLKLEQA